jgi:hypothetical protein
VETPADRRVLFSGHFYKPTARANLSVPEFVKLVAVHGVLVPRFPTPSPPTCPALARERCHLHYFINGREPLRDFHRA